MLIRHWLSGLFYTSGASSRSRASFRRRTATASRSVVAAAEVLESRELLSAYTLQILHNSDAEAGLAAIQDAPRFAAIVDALEDTEANSILLSSGDNYLPGPFFNASGDPSVGAAVLGGAGNASIGRGDIEIMNRLGYDASAMGNHEFDAGTREIRNLFQPAGTWQGGLFPYLTSNVNFTNEPDLNNRLSAGALEANTIKGRIAPSAIITENGEKIGIVGLTTPEIVTISSPGPNVVVTPGNGTYDFVAMAGAVNNAVDLLESQGVNKVILLSHLQQFQNELQLAPLLRGVDVILAGGSNTISADATDRLRDDDVGGPTVTYPQVLSTADHEPVLIASTDGGYRYLGRMVVTFNESGILQETAPGSGTYLDPNVSGTYATDDEGVLDVTGAADIDEALALSAKATAVKQVTDAIDAVISAKDGNIFGKTDVYLEGRRAIIRTQETNLGNLTADANLWYARQVTGDTTIGISLKNGGGLRDSIGSFSPEGDALPPAANPGAGKEAGDISQLDIENSLRFNNGLSVVSMSGTELLRLLESGVALSGPGQTQGRFPQIGGMTLQVDLSKPAGDRIRGLVATDVTGASIAVVQDGVLVAPNSQFRMVTLGFLAVQNGDNYPFSTLSNPQIVNLAPVTGNAFGTAGSEQKALADYLAANFNPEANPGQSPFGQADTIARQDRRIQQLVAPDDAIKLSAISTVSVPGGAEISAFDAASKKLFVTKNNGNVPSLDIVDISNPASPGVPFNVSLAAFGASISSVAVKNRIVAAAMIAGPKTNAGKVVFLNTAGEILGSVTVGAVPDMITFTPDGSRVLVAIEGEAGENLTPTVNNPEGGVSVITLDKSNTAGGSLGNSQVVFAGFSAFNSQKADLMAAGVRLLADPAVSVAMDLEPEYIAIAPDGLTARVTLQEANAIGVLDLVTNTFTSIQPLGLKDHSLVGNEFDASDRDGAGTGGSSQRVPGNFQNWPVFGVYMPDAIATFQANGQTYYVTANEGDARPNAADTADTDVARVGSLDLDDTTFPNETFLKNEDNLGRLNVLHYAGDPYSDTDGDGDVDVLRALGGRSFSIWDSAGNLVFDSGSELERLTLALTPTMFNANDGVSGAFDQRSDDKGPEPEGVVTGVINGRTYAFVCLERSAGGVMVYDVTNPQGPVFVQYVFKNNLDNSTTGDDVSPEGLVFIPGADSPSGKPLLVVSNEVSGTVTIYEIATSPVINEFVANHTGTDTDEFVEISGAPNTDYSDLSIVQIDGDGADAGVIRSVHHVGSTDTAGIWSTGFLADVLQDGSSTLLLVRGFTGAVGQDLDTSATALFNNDGLLEATPWSSLLDSVGISDGGANDRLYSTTVLGTAFGNGFAPGGASRIPNAADTNAPAEWRLNDFDGEGLPGFGGTPVAGEAFNTPGAVNAAVVASAPQSLTIPQIQGAGHVSPFHNTVVQTTGIVTARRPNGYHLQTATSDGNVATSEGIFVFTGTAPAADIVVGASVTVTGTVHEVGFPNELTITRITASASTVNSTGNPVPAATVIGLGGRVPPNTVIDDDGLASFDVATDGIDFYESLEGMLVQVNDAVAVSSNARFGEIAVLADNGQGAGPRSINGGILTTGGDFNPERIIIDDVIVAAEPDVTTGDRFASVTGVLDYSFGNFKLLNTAPLVVSIPGGVAKEVTPLTGNRLKLKVATFNVENLDGNDSAAKFSDIARDIVTGLKSPDIIGLQEMQDNNGAVDDGTTDASVTAQKLINAIIAAGGPTYVYLDVAPQNNQDGGEPGSNIRPGILYNPARVSLVAGSLQQIDPANPAFVDSRKPLAARFIFNGQEVVVVNNHFNSKTGDTPLFGSVQPPQEVTQAQRVQQAAIVRDYADGILATNPNANIIVMGDLNEFEFAPPLTTLTSGGLTSLIDTVAANERYSFNFDGNSQVLDHVLVSSGLLDGAQLDFVHLNTDFRFAGRSSDHDPLVATMLLAGATADAILDNGVLVVTGTNNADSLRVVRQGANLVVQSGTQQIGRFSAAAVTSIAIVGFAGDDFLAVDGSLSIPAKLYGGAGADQLRGARGNDQLLGGEEDDVLLGGVGDDALDGGDGNDLLSGEAGNDVLVGGRGDDALSGAHGDDSLFGGEGKDTLEGQLGNDILDGGDDDDHLIGENGDDVLLGGDGNDVISGGQGHDTLAGGDGDDNLAGNQGNDILGGGAGNDVLTGDQGDDKLAGGEGDDTLSGGLGNDVLVGGSGNDLLNGAQGDDQLDGGDHDDTLFGGDGDDLLLGGDGNDQLHGQQGDDRLAGGTGNDGLFGDQGNDVMFGGAGNDQLFGDAGNDSLFGGIDDDDLFGGNSSDNLFGGSGNDRLFGENGNDLLVGGPGLDQSSGAGGTNTLVDNNQLNSVPGLAGLAGLIANDDDVPATWLIDEVFATTPPLV